MEKIFSIIIVGMYRVRVVTTSFYCKVNIYIFFLIQCVQYMSFGCLYFITYCNFKPMKKRLTFIVRDSQ